MGWLAVADSGTGRVSVFCVTDGSFVRHLVTGLTDPYDVEECEGGWLVASGGSGTIEFLGDCDCGVGAVHGGCLGGGPVAARPGGQARLGRSGSADGEFRTPSALALVPGLGLAVRDGEGDRLQVFATQDTIAMASMSDYRVAWLVAVARAVQHTLQYHAMCAPAAAAARGASMKRRRGPAGL